MPEPTTTTTTATAISLSAVSILPFINGNALLTSAVLGAAFIATYEKDLSAWQRLRTMLLSTRYWLFACI